MIAPFKEGTKSSACVVYFGGPSMDCADALIFSEHP